MWFIIGIIFIVLFPIIEIFNMPLLLILPIGFILFVIQQRKMLFPIKVNSLKSIIPIEYTVGLSLSAAYFIIHAVVLYLFEGNLSIKDLSYFTFPLFYLFLILIFMYSKNNIEILKVYFYVNILIVLAIFIVPSLSHFIKVYYELYAKGPIASPSTAISAIISRPSGLLVHPSLLSFTIYLIGKYLSVKIPKYKYWFLGLSLITIVASSGRAALLILLFIEGISFILKGKSIKRKIVRAVSALIVVMGLFVALYFISPFFNWWINLTLEDLYYGNGFRSHSIEHRLDMFGWLFDEQANVLNFLFGGRLTMDTLSSLGISYIDSEFVMRILQFGLVGYLLLAMPFFVFYYRARKLKHKPFMAFGLFMIMFVFLGSLTTTIMTKMVLVLISSMVIGMCEREMRKHVAKEEVEIRSLT
ncbi:hypothetical protein V7138_12975 [Bacillus sp. JJ1533]|uniref:hypothetical protein n=1 Tax=Bacillus sp. JJ1533 TaxID=3122959 RepID=UPI002FFE9AEF